eukprot:5444737-Amphidinium_carterae.1
MLLACLPAARNARDSQVVLVLTLLFEEAVSCKAKGSEDCFVKALPGKHETKQPEANLWGAVWFKP